MAAPRKSGRSRAVIDYGERVGGCARRRRRCIALVSSRVTLLLVLGLYRPAQLEDGPEIPTSGIYLYSDTGAASSSAASSSSSSSSSGSYSSRWVPLIDGLAFDGEGTAITGLRRLKGKTLTAAWAKVTYIFSHSSRHRHARPSHARARTHARTHGRTRTRTQTHTGGRSHGPSVGRGRRRTRPGGPGRKDIRRRRRWASGLARLRCSNTIPHHSPTLRPSVAAIIGRETPINVMDVATQSELQGWTLGKVRVSQRLSGAMCHAFFSYTHDDNDNICPPPVRRLLREAGPPAL